MQYILFKRTITVAAVATGGHNNNKEKIFKNFASFIYCISEINNTQIDNAKDVDVVMQIYTLIEFSNNSSKTFWNLWQYYRDEPLLADGAVSGLPAANKNSNSFKFNKR